jgi:type VI secretion system FHA domain protein
MASDGSSGTAPQADTIALERALLEGLGVTDLHLQHGLDADLMQTIGALLREMTQGAIDLLRLRAEAKSSLHADMTILGTRVVNPLKSAWDADVALAHLLAPQRDDVMKPVRAIVDAYDDLRLHDRGLAQGIQAALAGLLRQFGPEEVEAKAGPAGTFDAVMPVNRKARMWELLLERYEDFSVEARKDFWAVFEREFRRAYAMGHQGVDQPMG